MMSSFFNHSGEPECSFVCARLAKSLGLLQIALEKIGLRDHGVGLGPLTLLVVAGGQQAVGAGVLVVDERLAQKRNGLVDGRRGCRSFCRAEASCTRDETRVGRRASRPGAGAGWPRAFCPSASRDRPSPPRSRDSRDGRAGAQSTCGERRLERCRGRPGRSGRWRGRSAPAGCCRSADSD